MHDRVGPGEDGLKGIFIKQVRRPGLDALVGEECHVRPGNVGGPHPIPRRVKLFGHVAADESAGPVDHHQ